MFLKEMTKNKPKPKELIPPKPISNPNKLKIEGLHEMLMAYTDGRDASQLPGFNDYSLTRVISETGTDMSLWPTEKHFTSCLNLAPWPNNSGKKKKQDTGKYKTVQGKCSGRWPGR